MRISIIALLLSVACTSLEQTPGLNLQELETQAKAAEGPTGLVGMTAKLDLKSIREEAVIFLAFENEKTGEQVRTRATTSQLASLRSPTGEYPIIFTLPVGRYRLSQTQIALPGGYINGRTFEGQRSSLGLEHMLKSFDVSQNSFTHLGIFEITLEQTADKHRLHSQWMTKLLLDRPSSAPWKPFQAKLATASASYLKLDRKGDKSWKPLRWFFDTKATPANLSEAEIQEVVKPHRGELRSCLKGGPAKVTLEYVIAPDGRVDSVSIKEQKSASDATLACMKDVIRRLRFPATPDDDYETWTYTLEI